MKEYKDEKNAYTFADVEHFAIDLLFYLENNNIVRTQLAKDLESNYYEIEDIKEFYSHWESMVSWLLYDAGAAKISPEEFSIPAV